MIRFCFLMCVLVFLSPAYAQDPVRDKFIGDLKFVDPNCESQGECELAEDFAYQDPYQYTWQSDKGDKTDGASIPPFLWGAQIGDINIGFPFDDDLIKAAVIHDHYCNRKVRSWWKTHRVFYHALLKSGVSQAKAKIMFSGVLAGGPKWFRQIEGKSCDLGANCINGQSLEITMVEKGVNDTAEAQARFESLAYEVLNNPEISLSELYAFHQEKYPDDPFLAIGDRFEIETGVNAPITE